ncbi:hypothetical protein L596_030004 [Steinernema carpocapsae]|uniref:Uncharacterized protein n=1 Tax=Steinernema carpocapsae TaxID=34508 RepID=A0A4U5LRF4_STECR|nr:hypothetical protein L596_030004 [Steinernema carpocapsae]
METLESVPQTSAIRSLRSFIRGAKAFDEPARFEIAGASNPDSGRFNRSLRQSPRIRNTEERETGAARYQSCPCPLQTAPTKEDEQQDYQSVLQSRNTRTHCEEIAGKECRSEPKPWILIRATRRT